jgi:hypothetical protein
MMTRFHLFAVLLLCMLETTDASARSERGEIGLALSWDMGGAQLSPLTARWPSRPQTAWHGIGRVGAHVHYGLSHTFSLGLGVSTTLPVHVNAVASSRPGATQQHLTLSYRDVIVPIEFALSVRRIGMVFVQTRLETGAALQRWQDHTLAITSSRTNMSTNFDLKEKSFSWEIAPYARFGLPLVWRLHDHASVQCMPYVALIGTRQWQVGLGLEISPLFGVL